MIDDSHEATALALELVAAHVRPGDRVLDVGTGDGVLCEAALRAGASKVVGFDRDRALVDAACARVPGAVFVWEEADDFLPWAADHEVVVANLPDPPLTRLAPQLVKISLRHTILVGARLWQADALAAAAGGHVSIRRARGGWCGLVVTR